jgi:hypothetical protein
MYLIGALCFLMILKKKKKKRISASCSEAESNEIPRNFSRLYIGRALHTEDTDTDLRGGPIYEIFFKL